MPQGQDDFDLDIDVSVGTPGAETNLFEMFHKQKKEDANAAVTFEVPEDDKQPKDVKDEDTTDEGSTSDKVKSNVEPPKADNQKIKDLINESMGGTQGKGDDNKAKDDKAKPAGSMFQTLYEHFTNELGYEPLVGEDGKPIEGIDEDKFIEFEEINMRKQATVIAEDMIGEVFSKPGNQDNAETAVDLFRFLSNGGKVGDYVQTRQYDDINNEYLTTDDDDIKEARSERLIRKYQESIGWDAPAIDKYVTKLKTAGLLEGTAEDVLPQFIKTTESRKTIANQQAIANKTRQEQEIRQYNQQIFKTIDENKEFLSFNLSHPKDKAKLKEYMYSPSVDRGDGTLVPQFVVDQQKARKNPNFTIFEALTLMKKGLDLDKVKDKTANEVKATLRDKLENAAAGKNIDISKVQGGAGTTNTTTDQTSDKVLDFENLQFISQF